MKSISTSISKYLAVYQDWLRRKDEEYRADPKRGREKLGWLCIKITLGIYIVVFGLSAIVYFLGGY